MYIAQSAYHVFILVGRSYQKVRGSSSTERHFSGRMCSLQSNTSRNGEYIELLNQYWDQGCGLRKIARNPRVPNHEILGAEHLTS